MELSATYVDVFFTAHCSIFFWRFSDSYTFPSERGTEALITSFFKLTSKLYYGSQHSLPSPILCCRPYQHEERTFPRPAETQAKIPLRLNHGFPWQ